MKTLDTFNFGSSIRRWIRTFYTNIESTVINNGFITNWFNPSRGVRQGCPLSPYLFVLSAELLSNKIRQDPTIEGIKIFGNEIKLSQFADDTNLFCADTISAENALRTVGDFGILAGLKLNIKKSKGIWLGKWMTSAYTVVKKIPLTIHSNIAISLIPSKLRLSNGLMQQIIHSSIHLAKKNSLASLSVHTIQS